MIKVDGSIGGGSVLRIAIPISISIGQELEINNIRKSRASPGLKTQHLRGIELIAELTNSQLEGAELGTTSIKIIPGKKIPEKTTLYINTAGSISLIFQMLSNYSVMSKNNITVEIEGGGTHTLWSPNLDYVNNVTIPALQLFGQKIDISIDKIGYYPKGGANVSISIDQSEIQEKIQLDMVDGRSAIDVVSRASDHLENAKVAERQIQGFLNSGIDPRRTQHVYDNTLSIGTSFTAIMVDPGRLYRGYSQLGKKGMPAEKVGKSVADQILSFQSPAAVDEFLADQLMLALSQSPKGSYYSFPNMTKHITTNFDLINSLINNSLSIQRHGSYYIISKI